MLVNLETVSPVLNSLNSCNGNLAPMISKFEVNTVYVYENIGDFTFYGFSKKMLLAYIVYMDEKLEGRQITPKIISLNTTARELNITIDDLVKQIIFHAQKTIDPVRISNVKFEKLFDHAVAFLVNNYRNYPEGIISLINTYCLDVPQKREFFL